MTGDLAEKARGHFVNTIAMRETALKSGVNLASFQGQGRPMNEAPVNLSALGIKSGQTIT